MTGGRPALAGWVTGLYRRSAVVAVLASAVAVVAVAAITAAVVQIAVPDRQHSQAEPTPGGPVVIRLPAQAATYLGAYATGVPASYAPIQEVADSTRTRPDLALYYSGWREPFQAGFARAAAAHGAVPLVQMEPGRTRLAAIANGDYDAYLDSYARAVAQFGRQTRQGVIIGFAHEPNGSWYPWGAGHASPREFIAAWRHIVTVFRAAGARNVTWLWTVNIIDRRLDIPSPARWWPGSSYVTWVGIDGYYLKPSWEFAPLFGPTIKAIRRLTLDPILISETAATPAAGKAAKIANLFAGVHAYGLLGFVWFDVNKTHDWRLAGPDVIAAYRHGATTFTRPAP
jgi:Glycosyl hydrolase family 26